MKTREEAVVLIKKQLANESESQVNKSAHHYGKIELRELLDFIYEGPPTQPIEEVWDALDVPKVPKKEGER